MIRRILIPLLILIVGIAFFVALKKSRRPPHRMARTPPAPIVEIITVSAETPRGDVVGSGTVSARREISLVAQVAGKAITVSGSFRAGGAFRKGDMLLKLEATDYEAALAAARAQVSRMEFELSRAEEEAEIAREEWTALEGSGRESAPPLAWHEPQLGLARANLDASRAALAKAKLDLERTEIRAPFDGLTLRSNVDDGQFVPMGAAVGQIHGIETAEIRVPVPDGDLAWIEVPTPRVGPDGGFHPPSLGSRAVVSADFAGRRHRWEGCVARAEAGVDERSRMVALIIEVDDPYRLEGGRPPLAVGMFVEVRIEGRSIPETVAIPLRALRDRGRVWVVSADTTLAIRPVEVARAGLHDAIVSTGLSPGERIVTSRIEAPVDGMRVRVADVAEERR